MLHPTSLPGRFGVGDLGPLAVAFLDFLAACGQRWWQTLPVGPIGPGNSPYSSPSSFAGNGLLISPDRLVEDGLLVEDDLDELPEFPADHVDFARVIPFKRRLTLRAFERFSEHKGKLARLRTEYETYIHEQRDWLDDYCLFMAIKDQHPDGLWTSWPEPLAKREPAALQAARGDSATRRGMEYHRFEQFQFDRQCNQLRQEARSRGIGLIGDAPIFVALDSVDTWANPHLFELDSELRPTAVAGVPPDYFATKGQLWGNPLYRWSAHRSEGYSWWLRRLKRQFDRADLVRLDHFRGFAGYYRIPAGAATAEVGAWANGPGQEFLEAMRQGLGGLPLLAEDLGEITSDVEELRDTFELPGMRVLQFGFGSEPGTNVHLPFRHVPNCLAYTATHDNDTTVGWFHQPSNDPRVTLEQWSAERRFVLNFLGTTGEEIHWDFIRLAMGSIAETAMFPMQDILGLGTEARMNVPGQGTGNWAWRYVPLPDDARVRERLAELTVWFGRWNGPVPESRKVYPRPPEPAALDEETSQSAEPDSGEALDG